MKSKTILLPILWGGFLFFSGIAPSACSGDSTPSESNEEPDSTAASLIDTFTIVNPPPPPPQLPPDVEDIIDEQTERSPFKKLGCCSDPEKRLSGDCCCQEVLELYKKMRAKNDSRIAKLKMNDPILKDCRERLARDFELVDNPPGEEDPLY